MKQHKVRRKFYPPKDHCPPPSFFQSNATPVYPIDTEAVLVAGNEYFPDERATWVRLDAIWKCVEASANIKWMLGCNYQEAKFELVARGFLWKWLVRPLQSNI